MPKFESVPPICQSRAPKTTSFVRVCTSAPAHMAHGSSVTYSVHGSRRQAAERRGCLGQRDHLGVRGRVVEPFALVVRAADDRAIRDDNGADRHFAFSKRRFGFAQGNPHEPRM